MSALFTQWILVIVYKEIGSILTPNSQLTLACQGITTSAKYIILCIFFFYIIVICIFLYINFEFLFILTFL